MQLSVEVSMIKHISGEEEELEKIMPYLNKDMVRVEYGGPKRGQMVEMIEHMLNTINCFASSHGSGWLEEKISILTVKFSKISPLRAGSYLLFPSDLKKQNFSPAKIETKNNNKCFLYCFIAAYHLLQQKNGPALYKASEGFQKNRKIATYEGKSDEEDKDEDNVQEVVVNEEKKETIKIVKTEGEFDMPMSNLDIERFERMNNVQINVFRYLSDKLIPVPFAETFVMDLFLLSDRSVLHYLLINDLAKLINFIRKRAPKIGVKFVEDAFIRAPL